MRCLNASIFSSFIFEIQNRGMNFKICQRHPSLSAHDSDDSICYFSVELGVRQSVPAQSAGQHTVRRYAGRRRRVRPTGRPDRAQENIFPVHLRTVPKSGADGRVPQLLRVRRIPVLGGILHRLVNSLSQKRIEDS